MKLEIADDNALSALKQGTSNICQVRNKKLRGINFPQHIKVKKLQSRTFSFSYKLRGVHSRARHVYESGRKFVEFYVFLTMCLFEMRKRLF